MNPARIGTKRIEYEVLIEDWHGRIPGDWWLEAQYNGDPPGWQDVSGLLVQLTTGDKLRAGEDAEIGGFEDCFLAGMEREGFAKQIREAGECLRG